MSQTPLNMVHPSGEESKNRTVTFQFVLDVLRRWWKWTMPVGLVLSLITGTVIVVRFEPVYRAKAVIWMDDEQPYIVKPWGDGNQNFVANQLALIRSSLVLGPALSRPDIARVPELVGEEDRLAALAQMIDISPAGGELYHLMCTSIDSISSARCVNAVADCYFQLAEASATERSNELLELLDEEESRSEDRVKVLRDNVRALTKLYTGKDSDDTAQAMQVVTHSPLSELQSRRISASVEQTVLEAQMEAHRRYQEQHPVEVTPQSLEKLISDNVEVQRLRTSILEKRSVLPGIAAKSALGEQDPHYLAQKQDLDRDQELLDRLCEELKTQMAPEIEASLVADRQRVLQDMQDNVEKYKITQAVLEQTYKAQLQQVKRSSEDSLDLEFARDELYREEEALKQIAARSFMIRTEQRAPARVRVLAKAVTPAFPMQTVPLKQIGLGSGVSLLTPLLLALLWELRLRRVSCVEELEREANVSVIGEVAALPVVSRRRVAAGTNGVHRGVRMFEESIDSLRTFLLLSRPLPRLNILAVVGPSGSEGKSTIASQLAVSIARASGEPTLLVDGDMRSPSLHEVFGVDMEIGLAQVLDDEIQLCDAVRQTKRRNLFLLPAGKLHCNPHRLVNQSFDRVLAGAREKYSYVVIDTPPVLPAGESLIMARLADATILCVRRDISRLDQILKTHQRLVAAGAKLAGCVMNGVPTRKYSYIYGNYEYTLADGMHEDDNSVSSGLA